MVGKQFNSKPQPRLPVRSRELLLLPLMASFLFVSFLAHTNYADGFPEAPLSESGLRGLKLWRQHNCQVCHQLYGFGGFLGPDLTNSITDQTGPDDFRLVLTRGKKQMPAFNFSKADQEALLAFLRSMNATGRSRPAGLRNGDSARRPDHFWELLLAYERESGSAASDLVRQGCLIFQENGCDECHVPFAPGLHRAPDLSKHVSRTSLDDLRVIASQGLDKMPTYELPEEHLRTMGAFLSWLRTNRPALVDVNIRLCDRESFSWSTIPWFEYR